MEDSSMRDYYALVHPLRNWIVEKMGSGHKPPEVEKREDSLTVGHLVILPIAVFATAILVTASL
jgi:hypothetical protein